MRKDPASDDIQSDDLADQINSAVRAFQDARDGLQQIVESPEVVKVVQSFSGIVQRLRGLNDQELEAIRLALKAPQDTLQKAELLGSLGWTFPVYMSPWRLYSILGLNDADQIDQAFVDFYCESDGSNYAKLREAILSNERLDLWRPLLQQCCRSYEREEFLIVVPSLLTVLEGVFAKTENAPFVKGPERARFFSERIAALPSDSVERYMWLSANAFVKRLFESREFGGPEPGFLNRHWVLHGRDTPEWGRADCLRLLQAVGMASRIG